MALTEPQRKFVVTFIQDDASREKRRKKRTGPAPNASYPDDARQARQDELDKLRLSTFVKGGAHDGKVATDATGQVISRDVKDAHADLEAHLSGTGRVEPATGAAKSREELKEDHLRKIYLMDEHGLNTHRLMDKLMTVDAKTRENAARDLTPDLEDADRKAIEAARMKMGKYEAQRVYLEKSIADQTAAHEVALGRDKARTHALATLAADNGNLALAHHASRHGPQTTMDEHATRVVTGFAPDHPDMSATTSQTYHTTQGHDVSVQDSRAKGGEETSQASRMSSAAFGLELVERALANAAVFAASGELKSGQQLITRVKQDETEPAIGGAAKLRWGHAQNAEIDDAGTVLPGVGELDDKSEPNLATREANKAEVIRKRALALQINNEIFGAEALVALQSDGSVSISTAYPAESVTADALGGDPVAPDIKVQQASIRQKRVQAAQKTATDAQQAADDLKPAHTVAEKAANDTLRDLIDRLQKAPDLATFQELREHTGTLAQAVQEVESAEAQMVKLTELRATCLGQEGALNAACVNVEKTCQKLEVRAAAQPGNNKLQASLAINKARLNSAQELSKNTTDMAASLVAMIKAEETATVEATARRDAAQKVFDTTRQSAVAMSSETDVAEFVASTTAQSKAQREYSEIAATMMELENTARLAMDIARDTAENVADTVDPEDATAVAARQQERDDRKDVLAKALEGDPGALDTAKAAWGEEITAVEAMFAADAAGRKRSLDALSERREAAAQAAVAAREAVQAKEKERAASDVAAVQLALDQEVIKLEAVRDAAILRSDRMGKALKQAKREDARQDTADAANIATARAALETLAAEVKAEKAAQDGTDDAAGLQLLAAVARAEEGYAQSDRDHAATLATRTEAQDRLQSLTKVAKRVSDHHEAAKARHQQAVIAGTDATPDMQKLKARIDTRFKPESDAAELRRAEAETALEKLDAAVSDAASRRNIAGSELKKAKAAAAA